MDGKNSDASAHELGEEREIRTNPAVFVRYWAGARAAAGCESESLAVGNVAQLRAVAAAAHPALTDVLPRCTVLVDGLRADDAQALVPGNTVEVLPPFAGG